NFFEHLDNPLWPAYILLKLFVAFALNNGSLAQVFLITMKQSYKNSRFVFPILPCIYHSRSIYYAEFLARQAQHCWLLHLLPVFIPTLSRPAQFSTPTSTPASSSPCSTSTTTTLTWMRREFHCLWTPAEAGANGSS